MPTQRTPRSPPRRSKQPSYGSTKLDWNDHKPYLLKHGTQTFNARVTRILYRTNIQTLEQEAVDTLGMNDIGVVEIAATRPIFFDPYAENRATGSFILIDPATNATVAAGMIRRGLSNDTASSQSRSKRLPFCLFRTPRCERGRTASS